MPVILDLGLLLELSVPRGQKYLGFRAAPAAMRYFCIRVSIIVTELPTKVLLLQTVDLIFELLMFLCKAATGSPSCANASRETGLMLA